MTMDIILTLTVKNLIGNFKTIETNHLAHYWWRHKQERTPSFLYLYTSVWRENEKWTWNQRWRYYSHVDNKVTVGANSFLDTAYIITANSKGARDFLGNNKAIHKHLTRQSRLQAHFKKLQILKKTQKPSWHQTFQTSISFNTLNY